MKKALKILHLEDLTSDADLVERELKKGDILFDKLVVDSRDKFSEALSKFNPDIILSDHTLASFNSKQALKIVRDTGMTIPFILVTATVSEEFAVEIMKEGASDYILKDRLQRLPGAITNAIQLYDLASERQQFLDTVIESEALMNEAEHLAHFGSWEINIQAKSSKWSSEAFSIHNHTLEKKEFSFRHFLKNVPDADRLDITNILRNAFRNHTRKVELDYRLTLKDGTERCVISELLIRYDEAGRSMRINGFSQDVTEKRRIEQELQTIIIRQKEEAVSIKHINRIADFVRHASHELRTPLAIMLLQTESALKKDLNTEEAREVLKSLKEDQLKMIDLTNALLMLSKYDETKKPDDLHILRVDELIDVAIGTAIKALEPIRIGFDFMEINLNHDFLLLNCNEMLMLTALGNLIKNAYNYSSDKTVSIRLKADESIIEIYVENKGVLLEPGEREKIFLPMVRGENAIQTKGFGLGLAIVKRIALLHHGDIQYEAVYPDINRFKLRFFTDYKNSTLPEPLLNSNLTA